MRQKFCIRRPNHCNAQIVALSTYKNTHTLKTMIGITSSVFRQCQLPGICVRSTDHRETHLTQRLNVFSWQIWELLLWTYICFAIKEVKVNTPTSLKGRSQLDEETMVRDRRNASKRIHVERIIGCAKTFKIMKTTTFKMSLYCFPQSK